MTVSLTHAFESAVVDENNPGEVGPDEWNAEHTLTQATGTLLGRTTAGTGATEEITPNSTLTLSGGALGVVNADLTKVDDTNVTLTLGGTPTGALLKATSVTLGWTGTLAAARLNANVVQAITNDTNVTGSIATQNLTLGWTGTLSPARGGTGVANNAASTITISGNFGTTFTVTALTSVTLPTTGTLATLAGSEELDNKTLDSSVGKGTWTASGTWTLPAHTLGGTVSGGGNEINNVKIGTSTPLAGAFTTLSATGAVTFGAGTGSATQIINGGNSTNQGAYTAYRKAGAAQWAIGHHSAIAGGTSDDFLWYGPGGLVLRLGASGSLLSGGGSVLAHYNTAIPAGGTAGAGLLVSSTSNFGIFFGSGAPSLSAAKGSLYLRSDGSTTNDRMYVNTDGGTTWTAVTTAA